MTTFGPSSILTRRVTFKSIGFFAFLTVWAAVTVFIFFHLVIPSRAAGTTNTDFAVDTTVYTDIAERLQSGYNDPYAIASVFTFPNTALGPVAISMLLNSWLLIFLFNSLLFATSVVLLNRTFSFSLSTFLLTILLNPTTTISLLCLNKEIVDLLVISLFLYSVRKQRIAIRLLAMSIALVNRYEIAVILVIYLFARSRWNPLRAHRKLNVLSLVLLLNFTVPFFASHMLSKRFEEAQYGGLVTVLDALQMHYLYILAVIPKIAEDLFGHIFNPSVWTEGNSWLYIMLFNNLANAFILLALFNKRMFAIKNDLVYMGMLGSMLVAQSLAIQPRYFYFAYVLMCIQLAHRTHEESIITGMLKPRQGKIHKIGEIYG